MGWAEQKRYSKDGVADPIAVNDHRLAQGAGEPRIFLTST
jgi:hypothetical protein